MEIIELNMQKIKVGIIGATGLASQELAVILEKEPQTEIVFLQSKSAANKKSNISHLVYEDLSPDAMLAKKPDLIFYGTPHGVAMQGVRFFLEHGIRVIDLSGDFRFIDLQVFEKVYHFKHTEPDLKGVFGLPEFFAEEIKKAKLIANPGCYVTSALLTIFPLKKYFSTAVFDSKSGYSGAGKSFNKRQELSDNTIIPYNMVRHRHLYEIQQFFTQKIYFTPHLINTFRGIETTAHLLLKPGAEKIDYFKIFQEAYKKASCVKVQKDIPNLKEVQNTDLAILGGFEVDDQGRLVIVSVLDNLRKGAASQAVENMRLMFE